MLNVLLESRSTRTRRVGGTVTSALVHAGLLAGAVALTMPSPIRANDGPEPVPTTVYIDIKPRPEAPRPADPQPRQQPRSQLAPSTGPVLTFDPVVLPIGDLDPIVGPPA